LEEWCSALIQEGDVEIHCPNRDCGLLINYNEVLLILSDEKNDDLANKFEDFTLKKSLEKMQDLR
jgi:hypothetical protein